MALLRTLLRKLTRQWQLLLVWLLLPRLRHHEARQCGRPIATFCGLCLVLCQRTACKSVAATDGWRLWMHQVLPNPTARLLPVSATSRPRLLISTNVHFR